MISPGGGMGQKIRHHSSKRRPTKFFGRYTAAELAMAVLGAAILILVVVLIVSAVVG